MAIGSSDWKGEDENSAVVKRDPLSTSTQSDTPTAETRAKGRALLAAVQETSDSVFWDEVAADVAAADDSIKLAMLLNLIALVRDDDETVSVRAAHLLYLFEGVSAEVVNNNLIRASRDPRDSVRQSVAYSLSMLKKKEDALIPTLIRLLSDEFVAVRELAAQTLGSMGERAERAIPALIAASLDSEGNVSAYSVQALETFGDRAKAATSALIERLEHVEGHSDSQSAVVVSRALVKIDGKNPSILQRIGKSIFAAPEPSEFDEVVAAFPSHPNTWVNACYQMFQGLLKAEADLKNLCAYMIGIPKSPIRILDERLLGEMKKFRENIMKTIDDCIDRLEVICRPDKKSDVQEEVA